MDYRTFQPHPDLASLVKCYWTLEIPAGPDPQKQRIIPDGCIEMVFILGDDIRRYTSDSAYIIQPRSMVIGQITEPFHVEPTGYVNSFAVRFYPYGFANYVTIPIHGLADKETPLIFLFGENPAKELEREIIRAADTKERIEAVERFLLDKFKDKAIIDGIVKSTVEAIFSTRGGASINVILNGNPSKRRQLERKLACGRRIAAIPALAKTKQGRSNGNEAENRKRNHRRGGQKCCRGCQVVPILAWGYRNHGTRARYRGTEIDGQCMVAA